MIWGLWGQQDEAIIDVKIGDSDADSYRYEPMSALLDWWDKIKKDKHGKHFHDQQKHFSLFVLFVNGMLGR